MKFKAGLILNNKFYLINKIATGGMGVIWRAKDSILDRFVAIKILKEQYIKNKNFTESFHIEAKNMASLNHENIAKIFDYGEKSGHFFLVMELIIGKSLSLILKEKKILNSYTTLQVIYQISLALQEAHSKKLVHKDIKPDNVLISNKGVIKIVDFGISCLTNTSFHYENETMGTFRYASPEQIKNKKITLQSDIFSLGKIACECLLGKFIVKNKEFKRFNFFKNTIIKAININNSIPMLFKKLLLSMLQDDPSLRPQSMILITREIKTILSQYRSTNQLSLREVVASQKDIGKKIENLKNTTNSSHLLHTKIFQLNNKKNNSIINNLKNLKLLSHKYKKFENNLKKQRIFKKKYILYALTTIIFCSSVVFLFSTYGNFLKNNYNEPENSYDDNSILNKDDYSNNKQSDDSKDVQFEKKEVNLESKKLLENSTKNKNISPSPNTESNENNQSGSFNKDQNINSMLSDDDKNENYVNNKKKVTKSTVIPESYIGRDHLIVEREINNLNFRTIKILQNSNTIPKGKVISIYPYGYLNTESSINIIYSNGNGNYVNHKELPSESKKNLTEEYTKENNDNLSLKKDYH